MDPAAVGRVGTPDYGFWLVAESQATPTQCAAVPIASPITLTAWSPPAAPSSTMANKSATAIDFKLMSNTFAFPGKQDGGLGPAPTEVGLIISWPNRIVGHGPNTLGSSRRVAVPDPLAQSS